MSLPDGWAWSQGTAKRIDGVEVVRGFSLGCPLWLITPPDGVSRKLTTKARDD